MQTTVYMKVSNDKYELPEAVANSWSELARICGCTVNTIHSRRRHYYAGKCKNIRFVKVDIEVGKE